MISSAHFKKTISQSTHFPAVILACDTSQTQFTSLTIRSPSIVRFACQRSLVCCLHNLSNDFLIHLEEKYSRTFPVTQYYSTESSLSISSPTTSANQPVHKYANKCHAFLFVHSTLNVYLGYSSWPTLKNIGAFWLGRLHLLQVSDCCSAYSSCRVKLMAGAVIHRSLFYCSCCCSSFTETSMGRDLAYKLWHRQTDLGCYFC